MNYCQNVSLRTAAIGAPLAVHRIIYELQRSENSGAGVHLRGASAPWIYAMVL